MGYRERNRQGSTIEREKIHIRTKVPNKRGGRGRLVDEDEDGVRQLKWIPRVNVSIVCSSSRNTQKPAAAPKRGKSEIKSTEIEKTQKC